MRATRRIALALCWLTIVLPSIVAFAQEAPPPHAPQIHGALLSSDELVADLKFLTELAPDGAKGWKLLKPTLDTFLDGIDMPRPIILDELMVTAGAEMRMHFPVKDPSGKPLGQKFLANLDGFGIKSKRRGAGVFELGGGAKATQGAVFSGFLRVLTPPISYASIATQLVYLPANLLDPTKGKVVASLLAKKYDVGMIVVNDKQAVTDQQARNKDFQKVKENLMAGLKKEPDEFDEDFELRKGFLSHNLAELERFVSESAELTFGWILDASKREARLDMDLTAIAESALATSAKLLGNAPGTFAGVPRSENAILSGRINFPLDELRKANVVGSIVLLRASTNKHIDAAKDKTPEQKEALKSAAELLFDVLDAGANAGGLDGMIEVSQTPGEKANLVVGLKVEKGEKLKPIVELVTKIRMDAKVQIDVEKVGDVSIHSIALPENDRDFDLLFGKGTPSYVGTSPTMCWIAIGEKSLDQLKAAIPLAGKPDGAAASNFFTFAGKAGPWIELLDARRVRLDAEDTGKKLTEVEAKAKKDRDTTRKIALDTFKQGKDTWETKLEANAGKVTGSTRFDEGILRFIGSMISKFSNETLR